MATAQIEGVSPYSQSKHYSKEMVPALQGENSRDYELRTWRERLHVNDDGYVFLPPMCFKNALTEAAQFLSIQVPGKGKATYTKHFEAGVLVTDPMVLPIKKDDVESEMLFDPQMESEDQVNVLRSAFQSSVNGVGHSKYWFLMKHPSPHSTLQRKPSYNTS